MIFARRDRKSTHFVNKLITVVISSIGQRICFMSGL